jgi:Glycosyl transferase family 2.
VIPAYRPDISQLSQFVEALQETVEPAVLRVEIDNPRLGVPAQLARLPADVGTAPTRRGKGAAITDGFDTLETDTLVFADADGAAPPSSVEAVLAPVVSGDTDLAVGSRRHPDATVTTHQTLFRRQMGDVLAWVARRFLPVRLYDYQCGLKAITADAWTEIRTHIGEQGFAWDLELISFAGAVGTQPLEVPIEWHDQPGSTVSPIRAPVEFARALASVRYRASTISAGRSEPESPAVDSHR